MDCVIGPWQSIRGVTRGALLSMCIEPVLDYTRFEFVRGKERIELTPTEFKLLAYLHEHAGRVCSKEALALAMYGQAWRGDEVRWYICSLRRKLGADVIKTRRLFGYYVSKS